MWAIESDSRTSVRTNVASSPSARSSAMSSSPREARRPAITTLAPSLARARAVALPIPDVAPVTSATLPLKRCIGISTVMPPLQWVAATRARHESLRRRVAAIRTNRSGRAADRTRSETISPESRLAIRHCTPHRFPSASAVLPPGTAPHKPCHVRFPGRVPAHPDAGPRQPSSLFRRKRRPESRWSVCRTSAHGAPMPGIQPRMRRAATNPAMEPAQYVLRLLLSSVVASGTGRRDNTARSESAIRLGSVRAPECCASLRRRLMSRLERRGAQRSRDIRSLRGENSQAAVRAGFSASHRTCKDVRRVSHRRCPGYLQHG